MSQQNQTTTQSRYYGDSQKKYYNSHKAEASVRMCNYYQANKDRIKQNRRDRYARQKAEKLAAQTTTE